MPPHNLRSTPGGAGGALKPVRLKRPLHLDLQLFYGLSLKLVLEFNNLKHSIIFGYFSIYKLDSIQAGKGVEK